MATRTPRRAPRAPEIPFPKLPDVKDPDALFWRASWLRATAQYVAVKRHLDRIWNQRTTTEPLRLALSGLWMSLQEQAAGDLQRLIEAGGLLFAWLPEGSEA